MIDLRTDFISRPTAAMIDAMMRAAQAAPGFGLRDDPIVAALGRTRLVVIENTHVRTGGTVLSLDYMSRVRKEASARNIRVHLDGSRLFNAAAALGVDAKALTALADTVAVSMNKGLGAPLGAILAGSGETIAKAVVARHRFGGSWRPANIPAAAALVALDTMVDRIGDDHRMARDLATRLSDINGLTIDLTRVQTNIVLVDLAERLGTSEDFAKRLEKQGVLALPFGPRRLRLVTWHEIGKTEVDRAVAAFKQATA